MEQLLKDPIIITFIAAMIIALVSTIIGCVIWFARLEGRLNYVEKDGEIRAAANGRVHELLHARINDAKNEYEGALKEVLREMNMVKIQLAELTGYLKKHDQS